MGVQCGSSCGGVFLWGQQVFQLGVFCCPGGLVLVKGVREPAPADILGEDVLLLRCGAPVLCFDLLQSGDGLDVAPEFFLLAACAQVIVQDTEILRFYSWIVRCNCGLNFGQDDYDLLRSGFSRGLRRYRCRLCRRGECSLFRLHRRGGCGLYRLRRGRGQGRCGRFHRRFRLFFFGRSTFCRMDRNRSGRYQRILRPRRSLFSCYDRMRQVRELCDLRGLGGPLPAVVCFDGLFNMPQDHFNTIMHRCAQCHCCGFAVKLMDILKILYFKISFCE